MLSAREGFNIALGKYVTGVDPQIFLVDDLRMSETLLLSMCF